MGRPENIEVFQNTEKLVKENKILKEAVAYSTNNQILIPEHASVSKMMSNLNSNIDRYEENAQITISKKRSYEAASYYKDMKTCVHNFASSTTPGGGVVKGSNAQEECLCRCSTLYFNLNTSDMWAGFYSPHRAMQNPVHNDDCIYTPDVIVFKTDTASPELMDESDWYKVNVITCAAPNLRQMPSNKMNTSDGIKKVKMLDDDLYALHVKRLTRIMDVAVTGGNEVIILGAFGCGAFENNPEVVAKASRDVINKYLKSFKKIEFAIYCSPRDEQNYEIFKDIIAVG